MDPLSVTASVVGLIASTTQIAIILRNFTNGVKDAPQLATLVMDETQAINAILCQLQVFLLGTLDAKTLQKLRTRGCLVLVEQVVALLTSCVRTCSDLEEELDGLKEKSMGAWDRVKWVLREKSITGILGQLQYQKNSLTCMLTILQAKTLIEAEDSMDRLCDMMQKVFDNTEDMSRRLRALEEPMKPVVTALETAEDIASVFTAEEEKELVIVSEAEIQRTEFGFTFEEDLKNSRPYRNFAFNRSGVSLLSTEVRTTGWSILSGLSLSDVSDISVLALPIYANEISNSERYQFGTPTWDALSMNRVGVPSMSTRIRQVGQSSPARLWKRFTATRAGKPDLDEPIQNPVQRVIFGVPIEESIEYASVAITLTKADGEQWIYGYIPTIIAKTGVFLKERGGSTLGLFYTSGSAKRMAEMHVIYNSPPRYGKGFNWTGYTVHDAAGIMLRYLNLLPRPLVSADVLAPMLNVLKVPPENFVFEEAVRTFQSLVYRMQPTYRSLVLYLLDLLAVIGSHSDENQLTVEALAKIFCRGFLTHSDDVEEIMSAEDVLVFLIHNQDHFLIGHATAPPPISSSS